MSRETADPAFRRRMRWRARRGLLENDLILSRFLARHEESLEDHEVAGLDELLDLTDNDLLDLLLTRREPEGVSLSPDARGVLGRLRQA